MAKKGKLKMERGNPILVHRGKTYRDIDRMTKSEVDFSRPAKIGGRHGVSVVTITRKRYNKFMRSKAD